MIIPARHRPRGNRESAGKSELLKQVQSVRVTSVSASKQVYHVVLTSVRVSKQVYNVVITGVSVSKQVYNVGITGGSASKPVSRVGIPTGSASKQVYRVGKRAQSLLPTNSSMVQHAHSVLRTARGSSDGQEVTPGGSAGYIQTVCSPRQQSRSWRQPRSSARVIRLASGRPRAVSRAPGVARTPG